MSTRGLMVITAGPTHEPIDAVRYIGNRSSGRLGAAVADRAAERGWSVLLLLGPAAVLPADSRVTVHRFRTTADLAALMDLHVPACDVLVMAAAVADYRPKPVPGSGGAAVSPAATDAAQSKLRRRDTPLILELEPTPDLLAHAAQRKRPGQLFVGFALEPRDRLEASAREKLARKRLDMIVANPLETMDSPAIEATVFHAHAAPPAAPGPMPKPRFAAWLLALIEDHLARR